MALEERLPGRRGISEPQQVQGKRVRFLDGNGQVLDHVLPFHDASSFAHRQVKR